MQGHQGEVYEIAMLPNERRALSCGDDKTVRLWDLDSGLQLVQVDDADRVRSLALSSDGRYAASGNESGAVRLYDFADSRPQVKMLPKTQGYSIRALDFSPDGHFLVSADIEGNLILWTIPSAQKAHEWRFLGRLTGVCFAPDSKHLATANSNGTVYILRLSRAGLSASKTEILNQP